MSPSDILALIKNDEWMMQVLRVVKELNLPDWMIGAGFVRGKVWDYLHDYKKRTPLGDVDVIYFDKSDIREETEKEIERKLTEKMPDVPWSVKNQARMHLVNNEPPYSSSEDALSKWPEIVTCIAVSMDEKNNLVLIAPHGIKELVSFEVKPSPAFQRNLEIYRNRIKKKNWQEKWPKLKIYDI